ncbi:MAG: ROK family protein [Chloroflexota bacterium]|nr:ROK family protein [Chloroflexota bacterium]
MNSASVSPSPPGRPVADGPVLALDLGASRIRVAVVTPDGRLLARDDGRTPGAAGPAAVVQACIDRLRGVLGRLDDETRAAVAGVGIAAPGPVDPQTGVLIEPPNVGPGFRDVPFGAPIAEALGLPVALERDTNVAALGEQAFGAARGARDFLYLTVSTGIGGGIVAGGELYGGAAGVAGEIGHIAAGVDEPPCGCGAAGHLEAISSGSGIVRQAHIAIAAGTAPGLARMVAYLAPASLEAHHVAEAEAAGDPAAVAIMDRARRTFAAAVVGLVNVFNPELVVIGGSIAHAQDDRLVTLARQQVSQFAFRIPRERVRVVPAALGDDVGLVGAQPLLGLRRR